MKAPKRLQTLIDDGLVDEVIRQLKSGKEADVYVVRCGSDIRCAKVYKKQKIAVLDKQWHIKKAERYVAAGMLEP